MRGRARVPYGAPKSMFDISAGELIIIGVVALVVIGPKELPGVLRTAGQAVAKLRRMAGEFQSQFSEAMREAELDQAKKSVEDIGASVTNTFNDATATTSTSTSSTTASSDVPAAPEPPLVLPPPPEPVPVTPETIAAQIAAEVPPTLETPAEEVAAAPVAEPAPAKKTRTRKKAAAEESEA